MKKICWFPILAIALSFCSEPDEFRIPKTPGHIDLSQHVYYEIDLKNRKHDTFKVRLHVDNLTQANNIFNLPATVPGVYTIFDIGRYVVSFKSYDENYKELPVKKLNTNKWELSDPENTKFIEYKIKETMDAHIDGPYIYEMAGSTLENDHVMLNSFDVVGYLSGLKERDFYLSLEQPSSWSIGTSLQMNEGFYHADNYNDLVDNPLLIGKIKSRNFTVDNASIGIHSYSPSNAISSNEIFQDVQQVVLDAKQFLKVLPVDRYNFLFYFMSIRGYGALEHSYSSLYVMPDKTYNSETGQKVRDIAAHEFFHIVTPLNIRSNVIDDFNFEVPTPSEHLWLYEGVTEWASLMMQYRNQHMTLNSLFGYLSEKKGKASGHSQIMSLSTMSLTCYGTGKSEFMNVYNKGALVAALLDIRLLELSDGTKGLREVMIELMEEFGPDNPFPDDEFFNILTEMTYPEIADFIDRYIRGIDALPLTEFFDKIGITYNSTTNTFNKNQNPTTVQEYLFNKWSVNF